MSSPVRLWASIIIVNGKDLYFVSTAEHTLLFFILWIYLSVLWVWMFGQCTFFFLNKYTAAICRSLIMLVVFTEDSDSEQHPKRLMTIWYLVNNSLRPWSHTVFQFWNLSQLSYAVLPEILLVQCPCCPMKLPGLKMRWTNPLVGDLWWFCISACWPAECSFDPYLSSHLCCITVLFGFIIWRLPFQVALLLLMLLGFLSWLNTGIIFHLYLVLFETHIAASSLLHMIIISGSPYRNRMYGGIKLDVLQNSPLRFNIKTQMRQTIQKKPHKWLMSSKNVFITVTNAHTVHQMTF